MRTVLFKLTLLAGVLALAASGCEEPTDPSLQPKFEESSTPQAAAPAAPTTQTSSLPASRSPAEIQRDAERGDVPSMLLLGRSYESLGQTKEARAWYQKAIDAGSDEGKQAMAALDAPRAATTTATTSQTAVAGSNATSVSAEPIARRRGTTKPAPASDPTKVRWVDITYLLDFEDMTINTEPRFRRGFAGVTFSKDETLRVAATGTSDEDLDDVAIVMRVRNRLNPAESQRVGQAGALTALVTADNVNQREFVEWVTKYLQTEQKSEPHFRNGWRIVISGATAEGRTDRKSHLGEVVTVELKRD